MSENNAKIIVIDTKEEIPVMFNPKEYTVSTTAAMVGKGSNILFQEVTAADFTVNLFYDTYTYGKQTDVRKETDKITALLMPTVEGTKVKRPPVCRFIWGSFGYTGIVHKIDQKFTMFLETGIPVRVELTVVFKSVITREEDALFKGKDACRKLWTVKSGDRLDLIAYRALNDPYLWRRVAEVNNITNPLMFPAKEDLGRMLIIPD